MERRLERDEPTGIVQIQRLSWGGATGIVVVTVTFKG